MNSRPPAKILLLEDRPHDAELAALVLHHHLPDAELIPVEDAIAFAEHLVQGRFNLVITERYLKWAEGSRILDSIKRLYPECPVIFFSAEKSPEVSSVPGSRLPDAQVKKDSAGFLHLPVAVDQLLLPGAMSEDTTGSTSPLLDRLPVGVFSLNREGRINCLNTSCRKIFKLNSIDQPAPLLQDLLADEETRNSIGQALQQGQSINDIDAQLCPGADSPYWIRLDLWPNENCTDEAHYFQGSVSDISSFKDAVSSLSRNAEELSRSNADLEKFAYITSHDLQEPLSYISRYASLLHERSELDDDSERFMGHIIDSSKRLQSMVDDILEYSRVGNQDNEFEPVDLGHLADAAAQNMESAFQEKKALYKCTELPVLRVDGRQITQLFQNLFSNALKFHDKKSPRILVTAKEKAEHWEIAVQDNGIGLEKKDRKRIFDMFQRLHNSDEYPGTGIGLAICRSIVERHGGTIRVKSVPGKGSIFAFTLRHKAPSRKA